MSDSEQNNSNLQSSKVFNKKIIKKGIFLFIGITILTFTGIFLYTNTGETIKIWTSIRWPFLLLGLVFVFNDLYLGAWRNHIFIREFVPGLPVWVSIKANLANIFMGAVTPSQSGGGPAQWYLYHRHGVPLADSMGNSFYNWISTLVFFPLTGAAALYILKDNAPDGFVMHLTKFGFSVFSTLLIVLLIGLFAPKIFEKIILLITQGASMLSRKASDKIKNLGIKGVETLKSYREKYLGLIKRKPQLMAYSFILTVLLYFNKYVLAYVMVIAFGLDADFWTVIAIQAVIYLLLYFAPSPGGSGIAELSFTALMAGLIGGDYAASFALLYRSFLVYVPALLGSYIVLRQISKE